MNSREEFEKWYKEEGLDLCENVEKYFVEKAWQHQQEKIDELKANNFAMSAMVCKHPDKRTLDENYDSIKDYCDILKTENPDVPCPACGGRGYIDNCTLSQEEHAQANNNPCDNCDDIEKCNVGDFVVCTNCTNGTVPLTKAREYRIRELEAEIKRLDK